MVEEKDFNLFDKIQTEFLKKNFDVSIACALSIFEK
jgi:dynein heavy chain